MRDWFVAKTKPRLETQTSLVLRQRGVEVYFPILVTPRSKLPEKHEPLFPGYLFARLDAATPEWVVARSAPGVAYFLGFDGKPTPVPESLVDEVRRRVEHREYAVRPTFRPGERVKIVGGPFEGIEAVFDGTLSPSGRSRVLVGIVSQLVRVEVDAELLRRVG